MKPVTVATWKARPATMMFVPWSRVMAGGGDEGEELRWESLAMEAMAPPPAWRMRETTSQGMNCTPDVSFFSSLPRGWKGGQIEGV